MKVVVYLLFLLQLAILTAHAQPAWQANLVELGQELRPRLFVFDPLARMKSSSGVSPPYDWTIGPIRKLPNPRMAAVRMIARSRLSFAISWWGSSTSSHVLASLLRRVRERRPPVRAWHQERDRWIDLELDVDVGRQRVVERVHEALLGSHGDGTVTVRDRDTLQQERVAADTVREYIARRIAVTA